MMLWQSSLAPGAVIDFCFMSDTIKSLPHLTWIKKGSAVPTGTATAKLNANSQSVASGGRAEEEIDITDWLGGNRSVKSVEQAVGLGNYGKTLTVLTCPSVQNETYQDADGDDEEYLVERWKPGF